MPDATVPGLPHAETAHSPSPKDHADPLRSKSRNTYARLRGGLADLGDRLGFSGRTHAPDVAFFNIAAEFNQLVELVDQQARHRRPVVLIDGCSGAGKSVLAAKLSQRLGFQSVSLDDCYPGWLGLARGAEMVTRDIVNPHLPGYRRWDWDAGVPAEWVVLDPEAPIIVEGCGALTTASASLATTRIWFERNAAQRRRLALARDGVGYEPWWDVWAAQEAEHLERDQPQRLANVVVVDVASLDDLTPSRTDADESATD